MCSLWAVAQEQEVIGIPFMEFKRLFFQDPHSGIPRGFYTTAAQAT